MEVDITEDNDSVILVSGEEHRQEGTRHYRNGNYAAALDCYTAAIDTEPHVASYYNNRSAVYIMLFKYNEAKNDAKKCVEMEPKNVKFLNRLGKCEIINGNWRDAEDTFNKVLAIEKNNEAHKQIGVIQNCRNHYNNYQQKKEEEDYRHSLYCLERCLEISPNSDELQLEKIGLLISLKRYAEAKAPLEKIINRSTCSQIKTEGLFYRGLIFYYMDHTDKASEHLQHVLRQNPDHVLAQKAYRRIKNLNKLKDDGNRYVKLKQFEKARSLYTEALEIDNCNSIFNAKLHCNRALTLLKLGHNEEALADCDFAIKLDPVYDKPKCRRISCLMNMEKWEEAVKEAEKLQSIGMSSDELSNLLKEAKRGLKRAGQLNPYAVLGVSRSAEDAEIKKAYKKKSLAHHPDRHPNETDENKKLHELKFKEIGTAYSILSDAKKKRMYDSGADIEDVLGNGGGFGQDKAQQMFQEMFFNSGGRQFSFNFG